VDAPRQGAAKGETGMKNYTFEQLCIGAAPMDGHLNIAFADEVMQRIQQTNPSSLEKAVRRADKQRKASMFATLRHLPKFALVLLAFLTLLTVTGTAYAIYTLWPKPVVHTSQAVQNQFGRTQVIASFENCASQPQNSTFEIKTNSTLSPDELPKVLQARCEMNEIEKWAHSNKITSDRLARSPDGRRTTQAGDVEEWTNLSSVGSKVVSITPTSLSLTGDEYNTPKDPLTLTPETKFIVNGNDAAREDIRPGDAVLFIKWDKYQYQNKHTPVQEKPVLMSETLDSKVLYVIKVDLPFEYYGPIKQNQIIERKACSGNPEDSCLDGGGVVLYEDLDIYQQHGGQILDQTAAIKTVQAIIQSHDGNVVTAKSSSGRIFTVTLPWDIISSFNTARNSGYNNVKIGVGDILDITYLEKTDEHATSLDAHKIAGVNVVIDFINKGDPIKKY
jgi:hypothetical protein